MNSSEHEDSGREHSQLFLVRLWTERDTSGSAIEAGESGDGSGIGIEWCGKLQHVVSGHAQYFRGWPTLIDLLLEMSESDSKLGGN